MFEKPTINDFLAQLQVRHAEVLAEFERTRAQLMAEMARRGTLRSSMMILQLLDATDAGVREGCAALLGELRRAIRSTDLDSRELRDLTVRRIDELTAAIISAGNWEKSRDWLKSDDFQRRIDGRIDELRDRVGFWIRQFDVGFDQPADPEPVGQVTNILHARDITGAVQQGQGTLQQSAEVRIEVAAAIQAIDDLEAELSKGKLPADERQEIESDLATIKAQLRKPRPSMAILREAGRTIRNVAEGVIAGALTPQGVAAAALLASSIGV